MSTRITVTGPGRRGATSIRRGRQLLLGIVAASAAAALAGCSWVSPVNETDGGASGTLGEQRPEWTTCTDEGLLCATVNAPLDWDNPEGETIELALIKREPEGTKLGTLFLNPGGPGLSGVDYYSTSHPGATGIGVKEHYDVIAWDARGVAGGLTGSTPVTCLEQAGMDAYFFGTAEPATAARGSEEWIAQRTTDSAAFAAACQVNTGELLGHIDSRSTVKDLEMLRQIVGDEQLNYLGSDYGTYIGALYADAYPEKVGRMVLDGAWDPTLTSFDVTLAQASSMERRLQVWAEDCLTQEGCPLGSTVDEARHTVRAMLDKLDATPGTAADGRPVTSDSFMNALLITLSNRYYWYLTAYIFENAVDGGYENVMEFADLAAGRTEDGYFSNYIEAYTATNCLDLVMSKDPAILAQQAAQLEAASPTLGRYLGYGDLDCAGWPYPGPAETSAVTAAGANPILVLSATDDPVFPYEWSQSLADQLESGVLVSFSTDTHLVYGKSPCVNTTVDEYFMEGTVPTEDPQCSEEKDDQLVKDGYDGSSRWPLDLK